MSGGMTIELNKGFAKKIKHFLGTYVWYDEFNATHIEYYSNYMKLDHNAGGIYWSTTILQALLERNAVKRFREDGIFIWETELKQDDFPYAFILNGSADGISPSACPVGNPKRKHYEDMVSNFNTTIENIFAGVRNADGSPNE